LYGAYGYTGRLAAELAAVKKLDVVLAGRNKDALAALGDRLSLPTRVVGLDDPKRLSEVLKDVTCVVHMAVHRNHFPPMLDACLATQTNYIDILAKLKSSRRCGREKTRSSGPALPSCREPASM